MKDERRLDQDLLGGGVRGAGQAKCDFTQRVARGLAWYGGSRALTQAVTWLTTLVVARLVLPSDFGLLGMALVYLGLVDMLNEMGLGAAIVQRQEITKEDLDSLFWFGLVMSVSIYSLTLGLAPVVSGFFGQPMLVPLVRFMGISLLFTGLQTVPLNLLTRSVDFKRRSLAEMLAQVTGAATTVGLALGGYGVWALAVGMLMPPVVMTGQVFLQTGWRPSLRFSGASLRRDLAFSAGVVLSRLAWFLQDSVDKIIVGRVVGGDALGLYSVATRVAADLPARLMQVANQVAFPAYSRVQNDAERLRAYFLSSLRLASLALLSTSLGLALVADDLVAILFNSKWLPIILPIRMVACGGVVRTLYSLAGPVILAKGRSELALGFNFLCLLVLTPAFAVGAIVGGLVGVCLVWVTVSPVLGVIWIVWTKPIIGFGWRELWQGVRTACWASAVMVAVVGLIKVWLATREAPLRLAVCVAMGALSFVITLLTVEPGLARQIGRWAGRARASE